MAMTAMNMVSAGGFLGVSFHLRTCPKGVASVLYKKNPIFQSRGSKLDHLTVLPHARTSEMHVFFFQQYNHVANFFAKHEVVVGSLGGTSYLSFAHLLFVPSGSRANAWLMPSEASEIRIVLIRLRRRS